jgi:hypothetical protein
VELNGARCELAQAVGRGHVMVLVIMTMKV